MSTIRMLSPVEFHEYRDHLIRLDPEARRLRFGIPMDEEGISRFVAGLSPWSTRIFVGFDEELKVVAAIQATTATRVVELALSIESHVRSRGLGTDLMKRALLWAQNRGVERAYVYCLAENHAMRRIARNAGMEVATAAGESEGAMSIPLPNPMSVLHEAWEEQAGLCGYLLGASRLASGWLGRRGLLAPLPPQSPPSPQP